MPISRNELESYISQLLNVAAYRDYGPCYIGTAIAYEQGGYETSEGATNVSPAAEMVLLDAIRSLLDAAAK